MNSLNSIESTVNFNITENKPNKMKILIAAMEEYLKNKSEDTGLVINKYLQALSVTIDVSIFDPHTNLAAKFFVNLYELMNNLELRSPIAWYCVDVLSNACKNSSARQALITTYQFIPSLSRMLGEHLTVEKRIRLLCLMQDLSCGIKISWQIPHLSHLMATLAKWVEGQEEEIVTLSLGVLVNLCYKNLPAIYTLSRTVDIKRFFRQCMPMQGPIIEVHTCKLLIILDFMNGDMPKSTLLKLVETTFKSIIQAYRAKDAILLRQIVEFFLDVRKQDADAKYLNNFLHYKEEVTHLLEVVENTEFKCGAGESMQVDQDPDCMALIFEFIHSLLEQKLPCLNHLHPHLIQLALRWIQTDQVSSQALAILRTIAVKTEQNDNSILEPLTLGLPVFLLILNSNREESIKTSTEHNKNLGALLELFRAMVKVDCVRPKVLQELSEDMLLRVFQPLIGDGSSPRLRANDSDVCSMEAVNLYIFAIALVQELSKYDSNWINLQSNLMQNKQIHMVLAQALYQSSEDVKCLVLQIGASANFPVKLVANAMGSLQSMTLVDNRSNCTKNSHGMNEMHFPVLSIAQIERLDTVLHRVKSSLSENNSVNVSTSEIMELYEFKLASMSHAERSALASVEAASERCTHLQHRTAQLTAELHRLHQLLFHTQQCHEQAVKTIDLLKEDSKGMMNMFAAEKGRFTACNSQLNIKEKALMECQSLLDETNKKLADVISSKDQLEDQNHRLKQVVSKLEENCTRLEKNLQKKEEVCKKASSSIEQYKSQVHQLELDLRQKEGELQAKLTELQDVNKELLARKQIIETINKVANSQFL